MAEGFVYVLTNEFMPGIVKIGYTNRSPEERAWELYVKRTGVPGKFQVAFSLKCRDAKALERKVHVKLATHRVNAHREYFRVDVGHAISVINDLGGAHQIEPKPPTVEVRKSEKDVERPSAPPLNPSPSVKTAPPLPPPCPHRLRNDYEMACADADRNSRAAAAVIVIAFIAPLTVFINEQIEAAGIAERSIWTSALGALVTYSLLRRVIGKFKRAKIEEEYRRKIER